MVASSISSLTFKQAWVHAQGAKGWLEREEAELLHTLALKAAGKERIVEIGSYCGRSSIILAAAIPKTLTAPVLCVDIFSGSPEHQPGGDYFDADTLSNGIVDTLPLFRENLSGAGLNDRVEIMRATSLDAAQMVTDPVRLLFLDADHSYDAVSADLRAWEPRITAQGWVLLHDVGHWEGPTRAAADLLAAGYEYYAQRESLLVLQKTGRKRR